MSLLKLETLLENQLQAAGDLDPQAPHTRLHFPSGQTVVLPTAMLLPSPPESPALPQRPDVQTPLGEAQASDEVMIPLVEEQLEVSKRVVETARVRLTRSVEEFTQKVSLPLTDITWQVEHIPVGQVVLQRPEPRQSGDTLIFPIVEERLVVQRELFLREEVHVRKVSTTMENSAEFTLQRDVLKEERTELPRE